MPPISSDSNSPYAEEVDHVNALLTAIDLAIEDVLDSPGRSVTRTEQEKLCYLLIREFDVPVTYSWYLAGANTKVTGEPNSNTNRIQPAANIMGVDEGYSDPVRQYRDYLTSTEFFPGYRLRDIWYTDRHTFLEDFYEAFAPDRFLDFYLVSTRIREKLESIENDIHSGTENRTLSSFTSDGPEPLLDQQTEEKFRLLVSDFHLELAEIDGLHEIVPTITVGTDVIEQVLAQLTEASSLTPDQRELVGEVFQYFYDDVWRYPALYISTQTAAGPNHHHLIDEHASRFTTFHEDLRARANQFQSRCEANGLYPSMNHHSNRLNDEQMTHLHELTRDLIRAPPMDE